jgi:hypothetical protein
MTEGQGGEVKKEEEEEEEPETNANLICLVFL